MFVSNARNHLVKLKHWKGTWKPTTVKGHTLVFNARGHLVELATWNSTCSPTVESRPTLAQNVRNHLVKQETWGGTWSPTLGRKYTNVKNAEIYLETWKGTCSPTVGRSHNAVMHVLVQALLELTSKHTPLKSQINANGATTLQLQSHILPNMCSPTVERSHITVKSAEVHSEKQELWKLTSAFTLEKNHFSAHNAVSQVLTPLLSNDT